jgi:hypothetical protein
MTTPGTELELDRPEVIEELARLGDRYETALVTNDVPTLQELFWDSPRTIRYGAGENLYGYAAIETFRRERPAVGLARDVMRREIQAFGTDTGMVHVEFRRQTPAGERFGRQTQLWRRFPFGWRIVSAHVSLLPLPSG